MNGRFPIRLRSFLLGTIVFLLSSFHLYAVLGLGVAAPVIGFLLAALVAFAAWWLSHRYKERVLKAEREANLRRYGREIAELYADIRTNVQTVLEYIPDIKDENLQIALGKICEHVEIILQKIDEHRPDQRKASATPIAHPLEMLVTVILPQYVEMQQPENGQYFPDKEERFAKTLISVQHLAEYYRGTVAILERGDLTAFDVALTLIDPFEGNFSV